MNSYLQVFEILERDHQPTMLEKFSGYNDFQQLIATLLSARTKDSTTIPIAIKLFEKYKSPPDFLAAKASVLEQQLYGIGFYRVKAKNIQKLSRMLIGEFSGNVPDTLEHLISLPGVGRKTANCMLAYAFHQPAIAVDVHVHRIVNRLGWVKTTAPEQTETELQKILPKPSWNKVNMLLVDHGQRVCLPLRPRCSICKIKEYCNHGQK